LVEGEGAPFEEIVYRYSIIDGIRDGYLVTPFTVPVDDKIDPAKLRVRKGEYTGESSDAQMIDLMDNHIAQMLHYGRDRYPWLVFEASTKAAVAMAARMNQWGIRTGLVLGSKSKADDIQRRQVTEQLRSGQLDAAVNLDCLTTGFDVQQIRMLVCRRRTKSLSLWVQILGRMLRTIGGNIAASIAAGKADALLLDFADNSSEFPPLDFLRPKESKVSLVSCEACGKRNQGAAARCWNCDEPMTKLCPACLGSVEKGVLDCPHCEHNMRVGSDGSERKPVKLLETPSGAALISSYRPSPPREGGWQPVRRVFSSADGWTVEAGGAHWLLPETLSGVASDARWVRIAEGGIAGLLVPNGANRSSVRQYSSDGSMLIVPMPLAQEREEAA
jgi:superfamily II DNA or RNA helicase